MKVLKYRSILRQLSLILCSSLLSFSVSAETINILKAGGRNDGEFLNTKAIEKAIDRLSSQGGGTLYFPAGTYLTGPITLKSNITLYIETGAVLSFSDNFDLYMPYVETRYEGVVMKSFHPLIYAYEAENIAIRGGGTLDGNGKAWWEAGWAIEGAVAKKENVEPDKYQKAWMEANKDLTIEPNSDWKNTLARHFFRPPFIQFYRCSNILIEGLHIQNSPFWTVNPEFCDNLNITGITINNPPSPNTDGINPESCRNVHISNCHISVGDDCITIKSGRDKQGREYGVPCENVTITNCTMLRGHGGVVIGSEMSGSVRKVTISNCVFDGTNRGIRLKSTRGRGGYVEEIRVDNVVMKNIRDEAIILTLFYSRVPAEEVSERTPVFRNIHISNLTGTEVKSVGGIVGIEEMPISNISLENIYMEAESGFQLRDVRDITIRDFTVNTKRGPVLTASKAENLYLSNIRTFSPSEELPVIQLSDVNRVRVSDCFPKPGSSSLVWIGGENSKRLVFRNNVLDPEEKEWQAEFPLVMAPQIDTDR